MKQRLLLLLKVIELNEPLRSSQVRILLEVYRRFIIVSLSTYFLFTGLFKGDFYIGQKTNLHRVDKNIKSYIKTIQNLKQVDIDKELNPKTLLVHWNPTP